MAKTYTGSRHIILRIFSWLYATFVVILWSLMIVRQLKNIQSILAIYSDDMFTGFQLKSVVILQLMLLYYFIYPTNSLRCVLSSRVKEFWNGVFITLSFISFLFAVLCLNNLSEIGNTVDIYDSEVENSSLQAQIPYCERDPLGCRCQSQFYAFLVLLTWIFCLELYLWYQNHNLKKNPCNAAMVTQLVLIRKGEADEEHHVEVLKETTDLETDTEMYSHRNSRRRELLPNKNKKNGKAIDLRPPGSQNRIQIPFLWKWLLSLVLIMSITLTILCLTLQVLFLNGIALIPVMKVLGIVEDSNDLVVLWNATLFLFISIIQIYLFKSHLKLSMTLQDFRFNTNDETITSIALKTTKSKFEIFRSNLVVSVNSWLSTYHALMKANFGSLYLHYQLLLLDSMEYLFFVYSLISHVSKVPSAGWVSIFIWLHVSMITSFIIVLSPFTRNNPRLSFKILEFIEAFTDLSFLLYSLNSLQYIKIRTAHGLEVQQPFNVLVSVLFGLMMSSSMFEHIAVVFTMVRGAYIFDSIVRLVFGYVHTLTYLSNHNHDDNNGAGESVAAMPSVNHDVNRRKLSIIDYILIPTEERSSMIMANTLERDDRTAKDVNNVLVITEECTVTAANSVATTTLVSRNVVMPVCDIADTIKEPVKENHFKEYLDGKDVDNIKTNNLEKSRTDTHQANNTNKNSMWEVSSTSRRQLWMVFVVISTIMITIFAIFTTFVTVKYVNQQNYCMSSDYIWGDQKELMDWCYNVNYFPNGVFGSPGCHCRIINHPRCRVGLRTATNFTIPSDVFDMFRSAEVLVLPGCGFTGEIPNNIDNLEQLQFLHLSGNYLSGSLSPSISKLSHLKTLLLGRNNFHGIIPEEYGSLNKLQVFDIGNNLLAGATIPNSFANWNQTILWFNFASNNLIGNISSSIFENFASLKDSDRMNLAVTNFILKGNNITLV